MLYKCCLFDIKLFKSTDPFYSYVPKWGGTKINEGIYMAYTAQYDEADLSSATIDAIIKAMIIVGQFVTLIVLLLLWGWMRKRAK